MEYVLEVMSPKSRMASLPSGVRIRLPGCGSDTAAAAAAAARESHRQHRVCQAQETEDVCLPTCVEEPRVEQLGEVGHHAHVHQVLQGVRSQAGKRQCTTSQEGSGAGSHLPACLAGRTWTSSAVLCESFSPSSHSATCTRLDVYSGNGMGTTT